MPVIISNVMLLFVACISAARVEEPIVSPCVAFKYEMAAVSANVTSCFVISSVPLRLCAYCSNVMYILENKYEQLTNGTVTMPDGQSCYNKLVRSDLISSIQDMYDALTNEWKAANCDNCNDKKLKPLLEQLAFHVADVWRCYGNFTNATLDYLNVNFEADWVGKNFNSSACYTCRTAYEAVNRLFSDISHQVADSTDRVTNSSMWGGVCGDVGDIVNTTRYLWSNHFHCQHLPPAWTAVVLPITTVTVVMLLFYCLVSTFFHESVHVFLYRQRRLRPVKNPISALLGNYQPC